MNCGPANRSLFARCAALALCMSLAGATAHADEWTLSDEDFARLDQREILLPAAAGEHAEGSFRAAIEINAPAQRVFRTMTDCAQALMFVPHLVHCAVLETAPDGSWQTIEQELSYGWYMPRARYVFRAAYQPFSRVSFSSVRGDFREHEGVWQLLPRRDAAATVVSYRAQVTPRFYVPRWMILASLKRDLPELMQRLRARCEAP